MSFKSSLFILDDSFIRYVFCNCFLPICGLSFHPLVHIQFLNCNLILQVIQNVSSLGEKWNKTKSALTFNPHLSLSLSMCFSLDAFLFLRETYRSVSCACVWYRCWRRVPIICQSQQYRALKIHPWQDLGSHLVLRIASYSVKCMYHNVVHLFLYNYYF